MRGVGTRWQFFWDQGLLVILLAFFVELLFYCVWGVVGSELSVWAASRRKQWW